MYAMKRITCHDKKDEQVAMREVEIMKSVKSSNVVPLIEYAMITVGQHVQSHEPITETLIVMPFYKVTLLTLYLLKWYNPPSVFGTT